MSKCSMASFCKHFLNVSRNQRLDKKEEVPFRDEVSFNTNQPEPLDTPQTHLVREVSTSLYAFSDIVYVRV